MIYQQVRCLHPWLFSEEGFKGICSGLSSWGESIIWSCWYEHFRTMIKGKKNPVEFWYTYLLYGVTYLLFGDEFWLCFPAIDAPGGFLFEWWSVFWDIFIARTNEKHSEVAASYIEVCLRMFLQNGKFPLVWVCNFTVICYPYLIFSYDLAFKN